MYAEEFGLIGGLLLIALYATVIAYTFAIAMRSRNHFGRLVAMGIATMFFLYVFINIAMVTGLTPVVGVPLPLISYGGTAMMTVLIGFGLVMNVYIHRDMRIGRHGDIKHLDRSRRVALRAESQFHSICYSVSKSISRWIKIMPDASATEDLVLYGTKDRIATITINRPDKLNALSNGVVAQLRDAMLRLQASDDMRAIVTAAGDRAFSVGADLRDPPRDPQLWECMPGVGVDVDKPLVAAVSGYCVGGAFCLVQFCDFAVASERRFFYPEAQIGFCGGLIAGLAAPCPTRLRWSSC